MPRIPDSQGIKTLIPSGGRRVSAPGQLPNIQNPSLPEPRQLSWTPDTSGEAKAAAMKYELAEQRIKDDARQRNIQLVGQAIKAFGSAYEGWKDKQEKKELATAEYDYKASEYETLKTVQDIEDPSQWIPEYERISTENYNKIAEGLKSGDAKELFTNDAKLKILGGKLSLQKAVDARFQDNALADTEVRGQQMLDRAAETGDWGEAISSYDKLVGADHDAQYTSAVEATEKRRIFAQKVVAGVEESYAEEPEKRKKFYETAAKAKNSDDVQMVPESKRLAGIEEANDQIAIQFTKTRAATLVDQFSNGQRTWEDIQNEISAEPDRDVEELMRSEFQRQYTAREFSDNMIRTDAFDRYRVAVKADGDIHVVPKPVFDSLSVAQQNQLESMSGMKYYSRPGGAAGNPDALANMMEKGGVSYKQLSDQGLTEGLSPSDRTGLIALEAKLGERLGDQTKMDHVNSLLASNKSTNGAKAALFIQENAEYFEGLGAYDELYKDAVALMEGSPEENKGLDTTQGFTAAVGSILEDNNVPSDIRDKVQRDMIQLKDTLAAAGKVITITEMESIAKEKIFNKTKRSFSLPLVGEVSIGNTQPYKSDGFIDSLTLEMAELVDPPGVELAKKEFMKQHIGNVNKVSPSGVIVDTDSFLIYYRNKIEQEGGGIRK